MEARLRPLRGRSSPRRGVHSVISVGKRERHKPAQGRGGGKHAERGICLPGGAGQIRMDLKIFLNFPPFLAWATFGGEAARGSWWRRRDT